MRCLLRLLLLFVGLAAPAAPAMAERAHVYAASSLTEAMTAIAAAYAATGQPPPVLVFAASSALARQIERGAPAGVFVSAHVAWADYLVAQKQAEASSRRLIAANDLVVIVPPDRARTVRIGRGFDITALLRPGRRWTSGDPQAVPVGRYARDALTRLGTWDRAAPRLARAENVRAALAFVERGDVDAGVVYRTDAKASGKVAIAGVFPRWSHAPIVYPALLTRGADASARRFHLFLASRPARAILGKHGFRQP